MERASTPKNEEDCPASVINLQSRELLTHVPTPNPLAGLAVSPDCKTIVAIDDEAPAIFLIDAAQGVLRDTVDLKGLKTPA